jgi:hypothetical protein
MTIQTARKTGYKVRVSHFRRFTNGHGETILFPFSRKTKLREIPHFVGDLETKGGFSLVDVTDARGVTVNTHARCHNTDNFNYKKGAKAALGRAIGLLDET